MVEQFVIFSGAPGLVILIGILLFLLPEFGRYGTWVSMTNPEKPSRLRVMGLVLFVIGVGGWATLFFYFGYLPSRPITPTQPISTVAPTQLPITPTTPNLEETENTPSPVVSTSVPTEKPTSATGAIDNGDGNSFWDFAWWAFLAYVAYLFLRSSIREAVVRISLAPSDKPLDGTKYISVVVHNKEPKDAHCYGVFKSIKHNGKDVAPEIIDHTNRMSWSGGSGGLETKTLDARIGIGRLNIATIGITGRFEFLTDLGRRNRDAYTGYYEVEYELRGEVDGGKAIRLPRRIEFDYSDVGDTSFQREAWEMRRDKKLLFHERKAEDVKGTEEG